MAFKLHVALYEGNTRGNDKQAVNAKQNKQYQQA